MTQAPALQIDLPLEAIRAFCQQWHIREFALFGSVLRDDFTSESDIDVLVAFQPDARYTLSDWLTMGETLEALFGRRVDLIDRRTIEGSQNYLRRKIILSSAQVVYAE